MVSSDFGYDSSGDEDKPAQSGIDSQKANRQSVNDVAYVVIAPGKYGWEGAQGRHQFNSMSEPFCLDLTESQLGKLIPRFPNNPDT